jgi:hypothetical protein
MCHMNDIYTPLAEWSSVLSGSVEAVKRTHLRLSLSLSLSLTLALQFISALHAAEWRQVEAYIGPT